MAQIVQKLHSEGQSALGDVIYDIGALEDAGKVTGMKEWVKHTVNRKPTQIPDSLSELLEARRLSQEIAQDPSLRLHVPETDRLDIHIERVNPDGTITTIRQVEVFTERGDLSSWRRFHKGIIHAARKAPSVAPGTPLEATIRVNWNPDQFQPLEGGSADYVYRKDGQMQIQRRGNFSFKEEGNFIRPLAKLD